MKISVVGSGIAGLATAARLAAQGHEVHVYESAETPGGKLSSFHLNGYRFDRGPSLFTMPQLVDEIFQDCGEQATNFFSYKKLDINCAYFWNDKTRFRAYSDLEQFANEIKRQLKTDPQPALDLLKRSEKLYELTGRLFLERSLELKRFFDFATGKALLRLPFYKLSKTLHEANSENIAHPKLQQYFNRFATYNGSDPYRAPAMLQIIPHFEHGIGAFFPSGGMHAITQAIYELAKRKGVVFHFASPVEEIRVSDQKVIGIKSKGQDIFSDLVISNMDMTPTYRRLLPTQVAPEKLLGQEKSSSALIFYWGIRGTFPALHLHNIFFSDAYREEFQHLFAVDAQNAFPDPTVYVNISSKEKPDDAPQGCENWFVMINVPNHDGRNWNKYIQEARAYILKKLAATLNQDIASLITAEYVWTPEGIEKQTSSFRGSLYGNASNSKYAAFLRHQNFSKTISGLYFCGGSVHPGGGIPLCLYSAKITADLIGEKYSNKRKASV
ncbi:MAG: 1-hydroxycarotenoid 3,4-desaturase CrtD [Bacteroidia bacterium]